MSCFSSEISPGWHKERCSCWPGSSAFSSGELSGTRKQLSAGLLPITACKGRRWLCRKWAGTGFLLPEEGKSLHQWDVLHALAGKNSCTGKCCPSLLILGRNKSLSLPLLWAKSWWAVLSCAASLCTLVSKGGLCLCSRVPVLSARGRIQTSAGGQRYPKPQVKHFVFAPKDDGCPYKFSCDDLFHCWVLSCFSSWCTSAFQEKKFTTYSCFFLPLGFISIKYKFS